MENFLMSLKHYFIEIIPAIFFGFLLSGIIYELIPTGWVNKYLGKKGALSVLAATIVGTFLPICCWGALPVAVSFYKKGAGLGPVLAFLVATPATSVSALLVTHKLLGPGFTLYVFFGVILMGVIAGLVGNTLKFKPRFVEKETCPHCDEEKEIKEGIGINKDKEGLIGKDKGKIRGNRGVIRVLFSILKYAFWEMPKELGLEILIGIILAAIVASIFPVGLFIKHYLSGWFGYVFSVIFGLLMYMCSTASVPLVDAFIRQGMNIGAGMVLLLLGPITSYGTILVLRKEFGTKILLIYLALVVILALGLGVGYQNLY